MDMEWNGLERFWSVSSLSRAFLDLIEKGVFFAYAWIEDIGTFHIMINFSGFVHGHGIETNFKVLVPFILS